MNVKKMKQAMEILKENLDDALMAADIYSSADGQSLVGMNSNPKACALFNRITNFMSDALQGSGFPNLNRYYLLDLSGNHMVIVIPMGDYQWGMLIKSDKAPLGLLLNVVLPKAVSSFQEAMAG